MWRRGNGVEYVDRNSEKRDVEKRKWGGIHRQKQGGKKWGGIHRQKQGGKKWGQEEMGWNT